MVAKCPASNTASVEQDRFWDGNWDAHKIGWLISGAAAAVTCLISLITILGHARNYNRPSEQRQIIRVLLFPPVYAVISFFSYRFFRSFTYYELVESIYEAIAIAAFLLLLLEYIGDSAAEQRKVFVKKDKKPLPLPFCCFRYRPSKAYFLVLLKWSVVQYCVVRPAISVAGIVTEYYEVYCSSSLSYKYAYVYLTSVDFVSISVALYGLFVLYILIKDDLRGRRPLAKFMTIKLGIFLIFYQGFVFDLLADHGALHATQYWTTTNISDGLNALCTSLEMVLIAAMQMWAFNWSEYYIQRLARPAGKSNAKGKTNVFLSILHALNFTDLLKELWREIVFLFDRIRGKEYTRHDARLDFVQAFGADDEDDDKNVSTVSQMELLETARKPTRPDIIPADQNSHSVYPIDSAHSSPGRGAQVGQSTYKHAGQSTNIPNYSSQSSDHTNYLNQPGENPNYPKQSGNHIASVGQKPALLNSGDPQDAMLHHSAQAPANRRDSSQPQSWEPQAF